MIPRDQLPTASLCNVKPKANELLVLGRKYNRTAIRILVGSVGRGRAMAPDVGLYPRFLVGQRLYPIGTEFSKAFLQ